MREMKEMKQINRAGRFRRKERRWAEQETRMREIDSEGSDGGSEMVCTESEKKKKIKRENKKTGEETDLEVREKESGYR